MKRTPIAVAIVAAALLTLSACSPGVANAPAATSTGAVAPIADNSPLKVVAGKLNFDFTKYCGKKPVVVGILDGYGANAWAVGKKAMLEKLLKSCSNVTAVKYVDAGGNAQTYIAAVSSLVAQGVNVIETFDFFGQSTVSAFTNAQKRGVLVGSANAIPGNGVVPTDFTSVVVPDFDADAALWVKFLTTATKNKGQIAYVGGPAGNLFDAPQIAAIEKAIKAQKSGIKLVSTDPLVGAWDPATTQQVVAGLLQSNPNVQGIINSYTATGPAVVRAFEAAGVALPAMTGQSSSMELVCLAHDKAAAGLQVQSLDGTPNLDAINLAKLLAAWSRIKAPELGPTDAYTTVGLANYIDTTTGLLPACDPTVPPGADFSVALDPADLAKAFK